MGCCVFMFSVFFWFFVYTVPNERDLLKETFVFLGGGLDVSKKMSLDHVFFPKASKDRTRIRKCCFCWFVSALFFGGFCFTSCYHLGK